MEYKITANTLCDAYSNDGLDEFEVADVLAAKAGGDPRLTTMAATAAREAAALEAL